MRVDFFCSFWVLTMACFRQLARKSVFFAKIRFSQKRQVSTGVPLVESVVGLGCCPSINRCLRWLKSSRQPPLPWNPLSGPRTLAWNFQVPADVVLPHVMGQYISTHKYAHYAFDFLNARMPAGIPWNTTFHVLRLPLPHFFQFRARCLLASVFFQPRRMRFMHNRLYFLRSSWCTPKTLFVPHHWCQSLRKAQSYYRW